jgi:poly-gamma-glutamate system protein
MVLPDQQMKSRSQLSISLLVGLLICITSSFAISSKQIRHAEHQWSKASGLILSYRNANGTWKASLDPALSGLIGADDSGMTTTLGKLQAKQVAAQSGWCRALGCLLDSLDIGRQDTVAVTMTGSFPGINLAVLLTLEAAKIPYHCVSSLGSSSYGANIPGTTWPKIESLLKERGILKQGSEMVTPGGSSDRLNGLTIETLRIAEEELRSVESSFHPANLRQSTEVRRLAFGKADRVSLYINVGGGHAAIGSNNFGRRVHGGLMGENEEILLTALEEETGVKGLLQYYFSLGTPVIHFTNIIPLARKMGLPENPQIASTPDSLNIHCGHPEIEIKSAQ